MSGKFDCKSVNFHKNLIGFVQFFTRILADFFISSQDFQWIFWLVQFSPEFLQNFFINSPEFWRIFKKFTRILANLSICYQNFGGIIDNQRICLLF